MYDRRAGTRSGNGASHPAPAGHSAYGRGPPVTARGSSRSTAHSGPAVRGARLGTLEPGTRQRSQLRDRLTDIAWTALFTVLVLWTVWSAVGAMRGTTAWVYCAVACVLLAVTAVLRAAALRRRGR